MITIELGNADHVITDVLLEDEGLAGIAFTLQQCPIGEEFETEAKTDIEMHSYLRIISSKPESLDVIIAACERAKARLEDEVLNIEEE